MTHDRTYYRQCSERQLIDAAQDSDSELAIALGERLDGWLYLQADVMNLEAEIAELKEDRDRLRGEVTALGGDC
jgi:hypothetical protein